jgi:hypothetical protein
MAKLHADFNGTTYEVLATADILIPSYQRELLERWADEIGHEWNARLFRPVTANRRLDGTYACIDGQHTLEAAIRRGHTTIPAIVLDGLTLQEEAAMFSDLNSKRRKPEAFDLWLADFTAEREWAVTLHDIATRYGLTIAKGGSNPGSLRAIGALRELILKGQEDVVDDTLDILTSTYAVDGPYNIARTERSLIVGMVDLIVRARAFDAYDKSLFKRKLARASYRLLGATQPITPDGFQSYINSLITSGTIVVPALNSGGGQARIYGKSFAIAILGKEATARVYGG